MTADEQSKALDSILMANLKEQRRARRWGIFFKMIFLVYVLGITWNINFSQRSPLSMPHVAFIDIVGEINSTGSASAENIIDALHDAYKNKAVKGIILRINSGGGLPVQGAYVYQEVRRLKKLHPQIPVYAVIQDVGASAAYYMAVAADKVFASPDSIVGSIGVLSEQYGWVELMNKIGVESRVTTAGEHKDMLSPVAPLKPEQQVMLQEMLNESHQHFIAAVREGRGKALKKDPALFSGRYWIGSQALKLGLIDGFGRAEDIAREELHLNVTVNYTVEDTLLDRVASRIHSRLASQLSRVQSISW